MTWSATGVALAGALPAIFASACGGSDLRCGEGTKKEGNRCVAAAATLPDGGGNDDGGAGGSGATNGNGGAGGSGATNGNGGAGGSGATNGNGGGSGGTDPDGGVGSGDDAGFSPPEMEVIEFEGATSAAPAGADAVQVAWLPASYPLRPRAPIHYEIYVGTASGTFNFAEPTAIAPPGSTSFRVEGLGDGEHFFVVRAASEAGPAEDDNTVEVSASPQADETPPTFAGPTATDPAGSAGVTVSWEPASDDLTPEEGIVYQVFWSEIEGSAEDGPLGGISLPGATSFTVTGLPAADADFYFTVLASDAAGNVSETAVELLGRSGMDETPPVFGGCLATFDPKATGGSVTWLPADDDTTSADEMTYNVYAFEVPVDEDTTFPETPLGQFQGVTSGQIEGLLQATDYRIVCRAEDAHGNEDGNLVTRTLSTLDDGTPPTWPDSEGLRAIDLGSTTAELLWDPARDDQTDQDDIVYEIYLSTEPGGQDFEAPPFAESLPGATGMMLMGIPSNSEVYVVVRARDEAGNVDPNTVERGGSTLVSFDEDVQPIFTQNCALAGCHVPGNPPQGQILSEGFAYDNIVDVVAKEGAVIGEPELKRVDSTSDVPNDSYLWRKITGTAPLTGSQMPPASIGKVLTQEQIDTITLWITQGAPRD